MKSLIEQYREEFQGIEFCCYCMEPKDGKHSCCQENHFIPFEDFDDKDQIQMIEDEIYWTEKLAKQKEAKNGR
jgi:hypothetical protein